MQVSKISRCAHQPTGLWAGLRFSRRGALPQETGEFGEDPVKVVGVGFVGAITSAFPSTVVRRCAVRLIRSSQRPVARRDAAQVAAELRKMLRSTNNIVI